MRQVQRAERSAPSTARQMQHAKRSAPSAARQAQRAKRSTPSAARQAQRAKRSAPSAARQAQRAKRSAPSAARRAPKCLVRSRGASVDALCGTYTLLIASHAKTRPPQQTTVFWSAIRGENGVDWNRSRRGLGHEQIVFSRLQYVSKKDLLFIF